MSTCTLLPAGADDAAWLTATLSGTSGRFGCRFVVADDGALALRW